LQIKDLRESAGSLDLKAIENKGLTVRLVSVDSESLGQLHSGSDLDT